MQPTRDASTLDLIFIDMVEYYEIPAILTPFSTSDHNVINWKSKCNKCLILKRNMAFKNKKVELVRSLRKRITAEIPRAKMSFY